MTVTEIQSGTSHQTVPAVCRFTVDIRLSDCYQPDELLQIIRANTNCRITVWPGTILPSRTNHLHPIITTGLAIGRKTYISPVSSGQNNLPVPSVKMGPGDPCHSHRTDEFIRVEEISEAIAIHLDLFNLLVYSLINNPVLPG